jgi:predicted nucleotidyltransferase component of viral defense system
MTGRMGARDLRALVAQISLETQIPERILEKDYWATEILRNLVGDCGDNFLFKGGTSLSKGYRMLDRYSEDLDLLVLADPRNKSDAIAKLDAIQASAVQTMGKQGNVTVVDASEDGLYRVIAVSFPAQTKNFGGIEKKIRLEPGIRGGPMPRDSRDITSLLVQHAKAANRQLLATLPDGQAFRCEVLHPARTLVEKLLAVHSLAEKLSSDYEAEVPTRFARHFYDIHQLCDPEGPALTYLVKNGKYQEILRDSIQVSERWFTGGVPVVLPQNGLCESPVFVDAELQERVSRAFYKACDELCFPNAVRPTWEEVIARVSSAQRILN